MTEKKHRLFKIGVAKIHVPQYILVSLNMYSRYSKIFHISMRYQSVVTFHPFETSPHNGQVTESGGFHADEWIVEASSIRRPHWGWFIHTSHKHGDDLGMVS